MLTDNNKIRALLYAELLEYWIYKNHHKRQWWYLYEMYDLKKRITGRWPTDVIRDIRDHSTLWESWESIEYKLKEMEAIFDVESLLDTSIESRLVRILCKIHELYSLMPCNDDFTLTPNWDSIVDYLNQQITSLFPLFVENTKERDMRFAELYNLILKLIHIHESQKFFWGPSTDLMKKISDMYEQNKIIIKELYDVLDKRRDKSRLESIREYDRNKRTRDLEQEVSIMKNYMDKRTRNSGISIGGDAIRRRSVSSRKKKKVSKKK